MSVHVIQTEVEIEVADGDNAYPTIEITFDYERGYTPGTPRGEYGPIDPPVDPELHLREATLTKGTANPMPAAQVRKLAEKWLLGPGRAYACDCAELDLLGQRAAHLENSREQ